MSQPWKFLGHYFPDLPVSLSGAGLSTGPYTQCPLVWTLAEMAKIEWTWKTLRLQVAGSFTIDDTANSGYFNVFAFTSDHAGPVTFAPTPPGPQPDWRGLIVYPLTITGGGRVWTLSTDQTFAASGFLVNGLPCLSVDIFLAVNFGSLYYLNPYPSNFTKQLGMSASVNATLASFGTTISTQLAAISSFGTGGSVGPTLSFGGDPSLGRAGLPVPSQSFPMVSSPTTPAVTITLTSFEVTVQDYVPAPPDP